MRVKNISHVFSYWKKYPQSPSLDKVRLRTSGRAKIKFMGDQFTNPTAQTAINITTGFSFLVKLIRHENEEVAAVNDSLCE